MNVKEHLLSCLAEECAEVAQRVSKALRFGIDDIQHGQTLTNAERIEYELRDLLSVMHMLIDVGIISDPIGKNPQHVTDKLARIVEYMDYARNRKALQ